MLTNGFPPITLRHSLTGNSGGIAQLVERLNGIQEARGSNPLTSTNEERTGMSRLLDKARSVIACEIAGLQALQDQLDTGFSEVIAAALHCLEAGGKLILTGVGKNLHIAEKAAATLTSTGSPAVVLNPTQAIHGDLGIVRRGDLVLILSYSGESEELVNLIPSMKRLGAVLVAITGHPDSNLAALCSIVAPVTVPSEACPFNMAPTTSTTATLVWTDAFAMVLLQERGFQREDYALLHPGGAIGRTLLLRVRDIMRTAERTCLVHATDDIRSVLLSMTRARAGLAAVTDQTGRLIGVFTDGDLRRNLELSADILAAPVQTCMTRKPLTVKQDELAVDVLNCFEEHHVDDLVVVDANEHPVGVVDIQDLPKFKIL